MGEVAELRAGDNALSLGKLQYRVCMSNLILIAELIINKLAARIMVAA